MYLFFKDTAPPEIYTLSLHDALPISAAAAIRIPISSGTSRSPVPWNNSTGQRTCLIRVRLSSDSRTMNDGKMRDRKSTRLNSSHTVISYAVFCLKKKKKDKRVEESNA